MCARPIKIPTMKINMTLMKILSSLGAIALLIVLFSFVQKDEKIAYVELQKVFQDFEGKIELEKRLQQSEWGAKLYVDSLTLQIKQLTNLDAGAKANKKVEDEIVRLKQQIESIEQQAYQVHTQKSNEFTDQIWAQINQYVRDFGEENDYDFILGSEGTGTLMYGKNEKNLTAEITQYINRKYNGQ